MIGNQQSGFRTKMSLAKFLLLFLSALALSACGIPTQTKHERGGMLNGYKDKQVGENRYRIRAGANGVTRKGFALQSANLRAAEVTQQNGHIYFRVNSILGFTKNFMTGRYAGQTVKMTIQLFDELDPETPADCFFLDILVRGSICNAEKVINVLRPRLIPEPAGH